MESTSARLRDAHLIANLTVVEVPDGPHNIGWTYYDEVNAALLSFLSGEGRRPTPRRAPWRRTERLH